MKKMFFGIAASVLLCGGVLTLSACGEQTYDMSKVIIEGVEEAKVVDYTGEAQSLKITNLPNGVNAVVSYFADEDYTEPVTSPVDAGTYYAKISFTGESGYKGIADQYATLTINKVAFPVDLSFTITGTYTEDDEQKTISSSVDGDGLYFEYSLVEGGISLKDTTVTVQNVQDLTYTVEYYSAGDVSESGYPLASNKITDDSQLSLEEVGDEIFVYVTLSDKNHIPTSILKSVKMTKLVKEIGTVEELVQMNKDLYEIDHDIRQNFKYVLTDDIDLSTFNGGVWQTIAPRFTENLGDSAAFNSEFDGNGKTIRNLHLTEDSLYYTLTVKGEDGQDKQVVVDGLYNLPLASALFANLGFFGFVMDSYVHDVNFENVNAEINLDTINKAATTAGSKANILHFGTCVATLCMGYGIGHEDSESSLENITAKDVTVDFVAGRAEVGGIIGRDGNAKNDKGVEQKFKRKGLKIENFTGKVQYGTSHTARISVGGICGETQQQDSLTFEDCEASGDIIVIGYDSTDRYTTEINLGGILGHAHNLGKIEAVPTTPFIHIKNSTSSMNFDVYHNDGSKVKYDKETNHGVVGTYHDGLAGYLTIDEDCVNDGDVHIYNTKYEEA